MNETEADPTRLDRWIVWLDHQIEASAASMSVELGDATACRVHKDGRVTGGLKYHEGRMTAFADARRLGGSPSGEVGNALTALERRWLDEFEQRSAVERPSPPWVAYATGGAEAAREARRAFHEGR